MKGKLTKIEEETQLPFESITTVEQCIEAFNFIVKELQGIAEDFEQFTKTSSRFYRRHLTFNGLNNKMKIKRRVMKKKINMFLKYIRKPSNEFGFLVCTLHAKFYPKILSSNIY